MTNNDGDRQGMTPDFTTDDSRPNRSPRFVPATGEFTAEPARSRRVKRRRSRRSRLWRRIRWPTLGAACCIVLLLLIWAGSRAWTASQEYHESRVDMSVLRSIGNEQLSSLSVTQLATIRLNLEDLNLHLHRLDSATTLPSGLNWVARNLPWVGPRYRAVHQLLAIGELTSTAGASTATVGQVTINAFAATGVTQKANSQGPTWLEALVQQQPALKTVASQLAQAKTLRSTLNVGILPASVRHEVATLDRVLDKVKDPQALVNHDLPALQTALGNNGTVRYLVLFQNPEELRLGGGFPGTMALVTIEHGQLKSYDIFDGHTLTDNYMQYRTSKLPQPWPIQQYFPQDGFLLQDASWFSNFPQSGAEIMTMYRQTTWPPINGVIAVEPAVIGDLLRVTGSVTVDVDGEPRHITPENLLSEIERQRELIRRRQLVGTKNSPVLTPYKEVLTLIGETIMQHLKTANRAESMRALKYLAAGASRRDIQIYSANQQVQQVVEQHNWAGQLVPDPDVPNLAVTFANVALSKASLAMQPSMALTVEPPSHGRQQVSLNINLFHTGTKAEDPFYYGFQKWWVEVSLPKGSQRLSTSPTPQPDPEAPNGGGYLIPIYPQQTGHISVTFSMPASNSLLVRRQPGVTTVKLTVTNETCGKHSVASVTHDLDINLEDMCQTP